MKAKIINRNYGATNDVRVLVRLPYTVSKPWLARIGPKAKTFRTHEAAVRWADRIAGRGKA